MGTKPHRHNAEGATGPSLSVTKPTLGSVLKQGTAGRTSGASRWLYELILTGLMAYAGLQLIYAVAAALGLFSVNVPASISTLDVAIYQAINGLSAGLPLRSFFPVLEDPGFLYSIPIFACLLYVWRSRRQDMPLAIAGLIVAFIVGARTIPYTHQFGLRPRPFLEVPSAIVDAYARGIWVQFPSFPSGHMREITGLSLVLVYFWRRAIWGVVPLLLLVSFLRVFMGAHYPTDVLGGLLVGCLSGGFAILLLWRARLLIGMAEKSELALSASSFLHGRTTSGIPLPQRLQLTRLGVLLALLVGAVVMLGVLTHAELIFQERILYGYLRNTDYSLELGLQPHFDDRLTTPLYLGFVAPYVVYPVLGVLALLFAWQRGRQERLRTLVAFIVGLAVVGLLVTVVAPRFERPLPFQELAMDPQALPTPWRAYGEMENCPRAVV